MSQRESGYERKERDLYETPEWVTHALLDGHLRKFEMVWEPAAGSGKMVRALGLLDATIIESDIADEQETDFLKVDIAHPYDAIITNPPYKLAEKFIELALEQEHQVDGHEAGHDGDCGPHGYFLLIQTTSAATAATEKMMAAIMGPLA